MQIRPENKDLAQRKSMGQEAVDHARKYAVLAEIRMGEMLIKTDRAKGGQPYHSTGTPGVLVEPSLADLNITKKESSRAQVLAELPAKEKGEVVEGTLTATQAAREFSRDASLSRSSCSRLST